MSKKDSNSFIEVVFAAAKGLWLALQLGLVAIYLSGTIIEYVLKAWNFLIKQTIKIKTK